MKTETKDFKIDKAYSDNEYIYLEISNSNLYDVEEKKEIINAKNLIIKNIKSNKGVENVKR